MSRDPSSALALPSTRMRKESCSTEKAWAKLWNGLPLYRSRTALRKFRSVASGMAKWRGRLK